MAIAREVIPPIFPIYQNLNNCIFDFENPILHKLSDLKGGVWCNYSEATNTNMLVYVGILYNTYKIKFNILTLRVMLIGSLKKKKIHLLSNVLP